MAALILTDAPAPITPGPRHGRHPSPERRAREDRLIERAFRVLERRARYERPPMTSETAAAQFIMARIGGRERELFDVAFLDGRNHLLAAETLFAGSIGSCEVAIRVILQRALALNAAAVILAHNHPSGDPTPSETDKRLTTEVRAALGFADMRVLDHIIVGEYKHFSFAAHGLL